MISCIIVDDEQHCVDTLVAIINAKFSHQLTITATATDSRKTAALVAQHNPQLLFLDVEMPHINGIQLMHSLPQQLQVIFTTAHAQYALQALKVAALDYLLKPISVEELEEAIDKAAVRIQQTAAPIASDHQKLLLPVHDGLIAANIRDIVRIESDNNYCHFYISGKPKLVVAQTLKHYEEQLTPYGFCRIHQSHLVNLHCVDSYQNGVVEYAVLNNGERIEVSRRRKAFFLQQLAAL